MSKPRRIAANATLAAGLLLLAWVLDPISARYEGRTARQWLNHYSQARQLPERAVVAHFGGSAIPMLLVESRPGGLYSVSLALEKVVNSRHFDNLRADDFDRRLACHDWAQLLQKIEPEAFNRALMSNTDAKLGLELARLFHGDRRAAPALKLIAVQSTNGALQMRAEELLEAYRALN